MTGRRRPRALALGLIATFVAAVVASGPAPASAQPVPPPEPVIVGIPDGWPTAPDVDVPIHVLVEGSTGQVLSAERADERRAVASTVKVLTALSAVARSDADDVVTVGAEVEVDGSSVELEPGDRWTVEQLVAGLLVRSGNDAAEALAVHVGGDLDGFLDLMAEDATALGLPVAPGEVVLSSPSGLGDANRLSASDLAVVARAALADPVLRPVLAVPEVTLPGVGTVPNRNELIGALAGATGVKTGFTEAAGSSLVGSATRDGREIVVVVLGGGPDPERYTDAATLLDHGFSATAPVAVDARRTLLVAGGRQVLEVPTTEVTVPTGATAEVVLPAVGRLATDPVVTAPLEVAGDEVAALTVTTSGTVPEPVDGAAAIGRGAVDGIHTALRAAHHAEVLDPP